MRHADSEAFNLAIELDPVTRLRGLHALDTALRYRHHVNTVSTEVVNQCPQYSLVVSGKQAVSLNFRMEFVTR